MFYYCSECGSIYKCHTPDFTERECDTCTVKKCHMAGTVWNQYRIKYTEDDHEGRCGECKG